MNNNYRTTVNLLQKLNEEDSSSSDSDLSQSFDKRLDEEFNNIIKNRKKKALEKHSVRSKGESAELPMSTTQQFDINFVADSSPSHFDLSSSSGSDLSGKKPVEQHSIRSKGESAELPMATTQQFDNFVAAEDTVDSNRQSKNTAVKVQSDSSTPIENGSFVLSRNEKRTSKSPSFFQWDKF